MVARWGLPRYWLLAVALLLSCLRSSSAPAVNPKFAAGVAARTVMVKVAGMTQGDFATGFVWGRQNGVSYVVTVLRSHSPAEPVLAVKDTRLPPAKVVASVGTKEEREYNGDVVAYDSVFGIALVAVRTDALPTPVGFWRQPVKAGTPLCVACCRGAVRKQGKEVNQPVAVELMHLGAMRKSKALDMLQLDGKIPEGGEGGPVFLANGALAGFCHSQLGDTLIGMAMPVAVADRLLSGEPSRPIASQHVEGEANDLRVVVPLLDAQSKVKTCSLHVLPRQDVLMPDFPEDGMWSPLRPNMREIKLPVTRPSCLWRSTLADSGLLPGDYWLQASTTLADGTQLFSMPTGFRIHAPKAAVKAPAKEAAPTAAPGITAAVRLPDKPTRKPLRIARIRTQGLGAYGFSDVVFCTESTEPPPQTTSVPQDVVWSAAGDALYTLWTRRRSYADTTMYAEVVKFSYPDGKETAHIAIAPRFSEIRLVPRGLLCVVPEGGLLLLDPDTLALEDRLAVPGIQDLATSPQGRYAVGTGRPEDRESRKEGVISFLQVVDLESWCVERVYCGPGQTAPGSAGATETLKVGLARPLVLTDDGEHLVVGAGDARRWRTTVFPFRQGRVDWESGHSVSFLATRLAARPGTGSVLADLSLRRWTKPEERPEGAPDKGSESTWLMDVVESRLHPAVRLWGQRVAASQDRVFVYTEWQGRLRILDAEGKEEAVVPLPHGASRRPPPLDTLVPSRSGRCTFLTRERKCYFLEAGVSPKKTPVPAVAAPAVPADATKEGPDATTATGVPLKVKTSCTNGWERQFVLDRQLLSAPLLLEEDGSVAYVLLSGAKGGLRRLDLRTMKETHRLEAEHAFRGFCRVRDGVLVAVSDVGVVELRLYDAATLRQLRSWPLPETMTGLVSRPSMSLVLMRDERKRLVLFDCTTGKITQTYETLPVPDGCPASSSGEPPMPMLSRDGTYAFSVLGRRLVRYRIDGGELMPDGFSSLSVGDGACAAVDPRRQYVAVVNHTVVADLDAQGWGPHSPHTGSGGSRDREDSLLIMDAESLLPVRQLNLRGIVKVAFDLDQSQLVTPGEDRIFPDGGLVAGDYETRRSPQGFVFEKRGGWFFRRAKEGLCRFRTTTAVVPLGVAPGEFQP